LSQDEREQDDSCDRAACGPPQAVMIWRLVYLAFQLTLLSPVAPANAQSSTPAPPAARLPLQLLQLEIPAPPSAPLDRARTNISSGGFRTFTTCPTCPTDDGRAASSDGSAPWRVGAFYTVGDPFNHVTFGIVGQRNERLPLYMSVPIGTAIGPAPPRSGANATLDTRTHWLATIAVEKALLERQDGGGLGVLGEAFLPFGRLRTKPETVVAPSPSGAAMRGALRVRF
jgi:hypothetical protein